MSKKSLDEALELMNLVSEQFGGFHIDLANGDSMKIADVLHRVADLLGDYDDDLDFCRRQYENADLAGAQAIARHAKDMADVVAVIHDIVTGKTPGKAPGIDIVEVVRCKDCKKHDWDWTCPFAHLGWVEEDGFCHWGEKKDETEITK